MRGVITFRSYLVGQLDEIFESAELGAPWKCAMICELASLTADYTEEGAKLHLDVFIVNSLSDLLSRIPYHYSQKLGVMPATESGIKSCLKKSASLARGPWKIYILGNSEGLEFGVFRDSGSPLNVSLDTILSDTNNNLKCLRVRKLAQDLVSVSTHSGAEKFLHFTNQKETLADSGKDISKLATIISSGIQDDTRKSRCEEYLKVVLTRAIQGSHGALIAVSQGTAIPNVLRGDCVAMKPSIDIPKQIEITRTSPARIPELYATELLVCGMFASDGIIVFNQQGHLLAYNAFIKLKASAASGGARRRAFSALQEKIGQGLAAAFFVSQDGASILETQR